MVAREEIDKILEYTNKILLRQELGLTPNEIELLHSIWTKIRERRLSRKKGK